MICTSYFAFIPKLLGDMLKVSVSLYTPRWARVDGCLSYLNPTEQLLREAKSGVIPVEEAMRKYRDEVLQKLSPTEVYDDLLKLMTDIVKPLQNSNKLCEKYRTFKRLVVTVLKWHHYRICSRWYFNRRMVSSRNTRSTYSSRSTPSKII
jgi:sarcosine oxidase delta subunit